MFCFYHLFYQNLHDGAGLGLPLRLGQSAHHLGHQAGGDLAAVQPSLPYPGYHQQHHTAGIIIKLMYHNDKGLTLESPKMRGKLLSKQARDFKIQNVSNF